jgi:hypothetical protein
MEFNTDLMLWATRFALSALVVVVWAWVIRKKLLPFTRRSISSEERSTRTFPTVWIVLATILTVSAYWIVTLQPIERTTTVPDRTLENRRQNAAQERVKDVPSVAPDTRETLEQRGERVRAESEVQNQKAKDDFKALKKP